ncbi:MAG: Co2+/Mg2+ efflux protein ApaG [Formosimonas sp.]
MFKITVNSAFWPEQSDVANDLYVFVYTIQITNVGSCGAQLLRRHWVIEDGFGAVREVSGEGVVGVQPHLAPNETFEYSSTCPLNTPFGTMHGEFYGVDEHGAQFVSPISLFVLSAPNTLH